VTDYVNRFSIAPMMDWTDRHCRYFHRLLTKRARLYTEMIVADAVIHGDRARLLGFSTEEHPVAAQFGGSEPAKLAEAARIAEDLGYDEINLNVGCPSDRVQSGTFGACLMREPGTVAASLAAMKAAVAVPVTVKCRLGVDDQDPEVALDVFADAAIDAGADAIFVHARKAWLQGLSPKENREVPPLDYDRVYRLKARLPSVFVGINGGIATLDEAATHLVRVDGVMLGRAAYHTPDILAEVDRRFFGDHAAPPDPRTVVEAMVPYAESVLAGGERLSHVTRHMLGLFHGRPGARQWRRILSVEAAHPDAGVGVVLAALSAIDEAASRVEPEPVPA
jgi:tRNA-dihydrouridine synthase A